MLLFMYIYIHTCIYIYIYIHMFWFMDWPCRLEYRLRCCPVALVSPLQPAPVFEKQHFMLKRSSENIEQIFRTHFHISFRKHEMWNLNQLCWCFISDFILHIFWIIRFRFFFCPHLFWRKLIEFRKYRSRPYVCVCMCVGVSVRVRLCSCTQRQHCSAYIIVSNTIMRHHKFITKTRLGFPYEIATQ